MLFQRHHVDRSSLFHHCHTVLMVAKLQSQNFTDLHVLFRSRVGRNWLSNCVFGRSQICPPRRCEKNSRSELPLSRVCSLFVSFTLRRAICRRTITVASWGGESTLGEGQGSQDTARRTRSGRPYDAPARLASELCAGAHRSPSHPFPPPSVRVRDDGERPAVPVGAGRGAIGS